MCYLFDCLSSASQQKDNGVAIIGVNVADSERCTAADILHELRSLTHTLTLRDVTTCPVCSVLCWDKPLGQSGRFFWHGGSSPPQGFA